MGVVRTREQRVVPLTEAHEPSAWMQAALRECVERARTNDLPQGLVAVRPNVDLAPGERACDRCGSPERNGEWFGTLDVPHWRLLIVVSLCEPCLRLEGVQPPE